MTKEQTIRLAKCVKAIADQTDKLLTLAKETLTEPKTALAISEPTAQIAIANEKILQVVKQHFNQLEETKTV